MTQAKDKAPAADAGTENGKGVAKIRPSEAMIKDLAHMATNDAQFSDDQGREIAARVVDGIAVANNLEELFNAADSGLQSLKESKYLGRRVGIMDVEFRRSDDKYAGHGLGVYVVLTIVDENGETDVVGTGAPNVVAFTRRAQQLGLFSEASPLFVVFASKETQNGELITVKRP